MISLHKDYSLRHEITQQKQKDYTISVNNSFVQPVKSSTPELIDEEYQWKILEK